MNMIEILTLVGLVGTLAGIIMSVYFYRKAKEKAKPFGFWYTKSFVDLEENVESKEEDIKKSIHLKNIEILSDNKKVYQLHKTTLVFENNGNKKINKSDLVPEYLELDFTDNKESDFCVLYCESGSKENNTVHYESDGKKLRFSFVYLGKNHFMYVTIIHNSSIAPVLKIYVKDFEDFIPIKLENDNDNRIALSEMAKKMVKSQKTKIKEEKR